MNNKFIYEETLKLGAGTHRKGFELLISAVRKVIDNPLLKTIKLYEELAEEFNDSYLRVERALRYYIQCIMNEGCKDVIDKLQLKKSRTGYPTVTEFIRVFALYLKFNFK